MTEPKHLNVYRAIMKQMDQELKSLDYTKKTKKKVIRNHVERCEMWNALNDAVEEGTVSPMDAYDALRIGYVPDYLIA